MIQQMCATCGAHTTGHSILWYPVTKIHDIVTHTWLPEEGAPLPTGWVPESVLTL
jgi:hypothetical protein